MVGRWSTALRNFISQTGRVGLNVLYEGFGNPKYAPCPLLVNMVQAGKLGVKSGEGFYSYAGGYKNKEVSGQFKK